MPLRLSERSIRHLLSELCEECGYCLSGAAQMRIIDSPPTNPKAFAEFVLELEGIGTSDPSYFDPVLARVCRAFLVEAEGGA